MTKKEQEQLDELKSEVMLYKGHGTNCELWNFYLNRKLKAEFYLAVAKAGYSGKFGGAAFRALMTMFVNGDINMGVFKMELDKHVIYTPTGQQTKL